MLDAVMSISAAALEKITERENKSAVGPRGRRAATAGITAPKEFWEACIDLA